MVIARVHVLAKSQYGYKVRVPYFDFNQVPKDLRMEWLNSFDLVVDSGEFIGGSHVAQFEEGWTQFCGSAGTVGVGNGLDALTLALLATGVGPGKVVAVPSHTFIATWLAVCNVGALPIGVDVCSRGLIDLTALEGMQVDAVIPVHLHGQAVDMPRLMHWASANEVLVIEDAAQCHGLTIQGKRLGSWGHAGAFSFYPTKNLGALGDGGAVVSSDQGILDRVRVIANYGSEVGQKYRHLVKGVNSRLDPLQAAVLNVNMQHLVSWNNRRKEIADFYLQELPSVLLEHSQQRIDEDQDVWHHFLVRFRDRDGLRRKLLEFGVGTEIHYPFTAAKEVGRFASLQQDVSFPVAETFSQEFLSLPLNQWMTDSQVEFTVAAIRDCF